MYLVGLIIVPILFLIAPLNYFDSGGSICLSQVLFDVSCYGCGMLRALKHLVFFDFETAWLFNKLSFVVLPLISWLWIKEIRRVYLIFRSKK
tara:strand:+ start:20588 stop:20863 length:276 start_codon:yes stop_codon:yes gene_type:complete